jgi:acetyl esterase/lipase
MMPYRSKSRPLPRSDRLVSRRVVLSLPLLTPLLAACSPLGVMNALVPKDRGSSLGRQNLTYGQHPRQRYDVYVPAEGVGRRPAPLLVFLYGGSWREGDRADYAFVGRAFAARGYVTAIPDYRMVPEVRYPDFVIDAGQAVAAFRQAALGFGGDGGPVRLVGHSAGAYNAVMLALAPELQAAAGIDDGAIRAVAALSGPYDFLPLRVRATREAFAGVADLEASQPVNRVRGDAPPMLLVNGGDDEVVEPANIHRLAELLRAAGAEAVTIEYPGLGHAGTLVNIARPLRWRADVLDDVTRFFDAVDDGAALLAG